MSGLFTLVELGVIALGCVQMACSVASNMLGKHLFEIMFVCIFWARAYDTVYIHGGTRVGARA